MFTSIIYFKNIVDLANLLIDQANISGTKMDKIFKIKISETGLLSF